MILAIESSCDESALAILDPSKGLIDEWITSQIKLHSEYGGIVPALASRKHLEAFPPLLEKARKKIDFAQINTIAVTCGPGLAGCLALGISTAKALSIALKIPVLGVNHLRGHVFSPFIELHQKDPENFATKLKTLLPHLGLIVSGGNTILFEIDLNQEINILAQTVDDAAGEALDKGAKLLGMPYPGGVEIEKQALNGDFNAIPFPQAFRSSEVMQFSFSGLKTSLRYYLDKLSPEEIKKEFSNICASYQVAVMNALAHKTNQALAKKKYSSLGLSGGVANNKTLRNKFKSLAENNNLPVFIAKPQHTGDNAGMIAFASYVDAQNTIHNENATLSFYPNLVLTK